MPSGPYLYSNQLNTTLQKMVDQKKFKHLCFYLEACESGSMFDKILPGNDQIWAITAANPQESSYAFYYNATLQTYLGDEFSIRWLEDSDVETMDATYTLEKQFELVQGATKESHVCKYGEEDLSTLPIGEFQLFEKFPTSLRANHVGIGNSIASEEKSSGDPVDVRDIEIAVLKRRLADAKDDATRKEIKEALEKELADRDRTDRIFREIVRRVTTDREVIDHPYDSPRDYECLHKSIDKFEDECGVISAYGLKYVKTMSALCDHGFKFNRIHPAIEAVCSRV
jgi:legumain